VLGLELEQLERVELVELELELRLELVMGLCR